MVSAFQKIMGTFLGVAAGDALGMPFETWTAKQIKEAFGLVNEYKSPKNHKWYDGFMPGVTTDDTQLTVALAESLIEKGDVNMENIVKRFVKSFMHRNVGWGGSTQEAAMRLALKTHTWQNSGEPSKPGRGGGNGVAMKIAPMAMMVYLRRIELSMGSFMTPYACDVEKISKMTHNTSIGVGSGITQFVAMLFCLEHDPSSTTDIESFRKEFLETVSFWSRTAEKRFIRDINRDINGPMLYTELEKLQDMFLAGDVTAEQLVNTFGEGSCYVPHSLPFTYGHFLTDPLNVETLYKTASAGGDTDTNASMVGALLGALNGDTIFPGHLREGLLNAGKIANLADRFYHTFSAEK